MSTPSRCWQLCPSGQVCHAVHLRQWCWPQKEPLQCLAFPSGSHATVFCDKPLKSVETLDHRWFVVTMCGWVLEKGLMQPVPTAAVESAAVRLSVAVEGHWCKLWCAVGLLHFRDEKPNLKDTLFEQLNVAMRSLWVCGRCPTRPKLELHGGRISRFAEQLSMCTGAALVAFCWTRILQVQHYGTTHGVCTCRSQNNRMNCGASATHSLCFLALLMLAVLSEGQRVLASVYPSTRYRSRH